MTSDSRSTMRNYPHPAPPSTPKGEAHDPTHAVRRIHLERGIRDFLRHLATPPFGEAPEEFSAADAGAVLAAFQRIERFAREAGAVAIDGMNPTTELNVERFVSAIAAGAAEREAS